MLGDYFCILCGSDPRTERHVLLTPLSADGHSRDGAELTEWSEDLSASVDHSSCYFLKSLLSPSLFSLFGLIFVMLKT